MKLVFKRPTPFWLDAFCSSAGFVLPRHVFEPYKGGRSREAPANLKPVGTGPTAASTSSRATRSAPTINPPTMCPTGRSSTRSRFKGGGDRLGRARVADRPVRLRLGLNMEDEILRRLEEGGKGRVVIGRTTNIDYIRLDQADPGRDVDGERASIETTTHPVLTDPAVRSALAMLVDRAGIQGEIWGRQGDTTGNFLNRRPFASPTTKSEFNPDKASAALEAGGWKRGADGIRAKDGKRLKILFQTVNQPIRQKMQQVVKQACGRAGIECELKARHGFRVLLLGPRQRRHRGPLLRRPASSRRDPPPARSPGVHARLLLVEVAQKSNKWAGVNVSRSATTSPTACRAPPRRRSDPVERAPCSSDERQRGSPNGAVIRW